MAEWAIEVVEESFIMIEAALDLIIVEIFMIIEIEEMVADSDLPDRDLGLLEVDMEKDKNITKEIALEAEEKDQDQVVATTIECSIENGTTVTIDILETEEA